MRRPDGRSCASCRTRHLKCDLVRPVCLRCQKDGFECDGYTSMQIVQVQFQASARNDNAAHLAHSFREPKYTTLLRSPTLPTACTMGTLCSDLRGDLFANHPEQWIGFEAIRSPYGLAGSCLFALSQTYHERKRSVTVTDRRGMSLYSDCLQNVNQTLSQPGLCKNADTLLAVAILGVFEMLFLTAQSSWIRHLSGVAALMELNGPQVCGSKVGFEVFRSQRFPMILAALATRSSTFLATNQWKDLPWQLQGAQKGFMDTLLDILVDLPALKVATLDEESSESEHSNRESRLYKTAVRICDRLEQWKHSWVTSSDFQPPTYVKPAPGYPHTWQEPLCFSDIQTADTYCLYNAASICALEAARKFSTFSQLRPRDLDALFSKRHQAAVEICRAVHFQLTAHAHGLGELYILWPLRMAWLTLQQSDRQVVAWLKTQLDAVVLNHRIWEVAKETLRP